MKILCFILVFVCTSMNINYCVATSSKSNSNFSLCFDINKLPAPKIISIVPHKKKKGSGVYLNAILYSSRNNWTIWINEEKINLLKKINNIEIVSVTKDHVDLVWSHNSFQHKMRLKPHESFNPNGLKVVGGDCRLLG